MNMVTEKAYAKINLMLGVLYKRMDGYHALDSLMQSVSLCDEVIVRRSRRVEVTCTGNVLPYDNTVRRAVEKYRSLTGNGASVQVIKRIPMEAGLGGGSTDAAAVLRGMQRIYHGLSDGLLRDVALSIGADVPFCLHGGTARAQGIGEIITSIKAPVWHYVIVKPKEGVSTKMLYANLPLPRENPDITAGMSALAADDARAFGKFMVNALEDTATKWAPQIEVLKEKLLNAGACGSCMTGSGSAVFGLFDSKETAEIAQKTVADADFSCICHSVQ